MATNVNFSNQSILSYYCTPSVGNTIDWMTGRDYLENKLSGLVNNAVSEDPQKLLDLRKQLFNNKRIEQVSIPSKDGLTTLDGALFKSEKPAKGAIFLILGSGGCYEKIADENDLASSFVNFFQSDVGNDIDILVVNPRGIGESKGAPSYQKWVSDMHDGVKYLLDKGYSAEHVLVYGHSFGGWIGVDAVKNFNDQKKEISVASDRAFSNFANEVFYYLGGGIKGYAAYALATYAKWNANTEQSWQSLIDKSLIIYSPDDHTIPPAASLFAGLQKKGYFKQDSDTHYFIFRGGNEVHKRSFTQEEKAQLAPTLRQMMNLNS